MATREEIMEWAKHFLEGTAHNGYYDGLEVTMLEELSELGAVIKVEREWVGCEETKVYMGRAGCIAIEPLINKEVN